MLNKNIKGKYEFYVRLSNKVIKIESVHDFAYYFCVGYRIDDMIAGCDYHVKTSKSEILVERERLIKADKNNENHPLAYIEVILIYKKISEVLISSRIILVHGCAVSVNGASFLFMAPSGTGKTTHALLWRNNIDGARIINGDKPLLSIEGNELRAWGTPWCGKEGFNQNIGVPVSGISVLQRSEENSIEKITKSKALFALLKHVYLPKETDKSRIVYEMLTDICSMVPFYIIRCNMEKEAAIMAYYFMKAGD